MNMSLVLLSLLGVVSADPVFVAKDQIHDTAPGLEYVIVHPDCAAAVYTIENSSFTYNVHSDELTNAACNDPVGHDKAIVNITGLPEGCDAVKALIEKKVKLYTPGTDASKSYDPHGTGKGYVKPQNPDPSQILLIRLAGVGGKGLKYYQDTVALEFISAADGSCNVNAASQSEVSAGGDAGTNLCNIYNLISDIAKTHGAEDLGRAGADFTKTCCTNDVPCFATKEQSGRRRRKHKCKKQGKRCETGDCCEGLHCIVGEAYPRCALDYAVADSSSVVV